jgi:Tol biopolymer transport system component
MRTLAFSILLVLSCNAAFSQFQEDFTFKEDIGSPAIRGNTVFDRTTQEYIISAGGYNIWFNRDEFHYAYNPVKGDFIYTANFQLDEGGDPHRKTGWMIRSNKDSQSAHISATLHGDGMLALQWRPLRGAYMRDPQDEIRFPKKKAEVIQLERQGKTFIMRAAPVGEPLQEVGRREFPDMPDSLMAGVFACSHDPGKTTRARIWNLRLDRAESKGLKPKSRLEFIDIKTGVRKIVHRSSTRFEAPNYMHDGRTLLYNEGGLLYTIPETGGEPVLLNTGTVKQNNNDHGISFDGKMIAISSQRTGKPGGGSTLYTVPLAGGEPKMINDNTPSYWHGWAPDGKSVLVIAQRGTPIYNVYRVNLKDGSEINLTGNESGHVDGSEYSPDGQWIYFNWNVTGTMQIWRMKPDGSQKEQITFDEYNNWFPHISPDGKWMAMISFNNEIDPGSHPADKRVILRLLPLSGGAPRVIAYIYGGQGTINVPSWSPDSRKLAFVSYTY